MSSFGTFLAEQEQPGRGHETYAHDLRKMNHNIPRFMKTHVSSDACVDLNLDGRTFSERMRGGCLTRCLHLQQLEKRFTRAQCTQTKQVRYNFDPPPSVRLTYRQLPVNVNVHRCKLLKGEAGVSLT